MLTVTEGDTTQCPKQCCLHREETLFSVGLKSSTEALFGNWAIDQSADKDFSDRSFLSLFFFQPLETAACRTATYW